MHTPTLYAVSRASARTACLLALMAALASAPRPLGAQNAATAFLPPPPPTVSTVPPNGDLNPYGVAFMPPPLQENAPPIANSVLQPGDLLVSNFNGAVNLPGTGTTLVRIDARGRKTLFFQASTQYAGLDAALAVLRDGTVLVGNLKTFDGTLATSSPGAIQIISPSGVLQNIIAGPAIDGPWGMAVRESQDSVEVFVSNVLNGTIVRLIFLRSGGGLSLEKTTVIAAGLYHEGDPAAIEIGPSGLLYSPNEDTLYFASSVDNAIYRIQHASTVGADHAAPELVVQDQTHLHAPADLAFAPNGDLLVANSDTLDFDPNQPSEIVEYTQDGTFVAEFPVDPNGGGAFGIATQRLGKAARLAAVDDNASNVTIYNEWNQ